MIYLPFLVRSLNWQISKYSMPSMRQESFQRVLESCYLCPNLIWVKFSVVKYPNRSANWVNLKICMHKIWDCQYFPIRLANCNPFHIWICKKIYSLRCLNLLGNYVIWKSPIYLKINLALYLNQSVSYSIWHN